MLLQQRWIILQMDQDGQITILLLFPSRLHQNGYQRSKTRRRPMRTTYWTRLQRSRLVRETLIKWWCHLQGQIRSNLKWKCIIITKMPWQAWHKIWELLNKQDRQTRHRILSTILPWTHPRRKRILEEVSLVSNQRARTEMAVPEM